MFDIWHDDFGSRNQHPEKNLNQSTQYMISKEEFLNKDRIIKSISTGKSIKIHVVKTTEVVQEAQKRHNLSPIAALMLGRMMTGTMLIAAQLKGEERIKMTIQNNGVLGNIYAEANSVGEMRGYVTHPEVHIDWTKTDNIQTVLGAGGLTVEKILYNEAKPLTGVVELKDGTITGDIAHYLMQSEQVNSMLALDVQLDNEGKVTEAGGVLVQAMPGADEDVLAEVQKRVHNLPPVGVLLGEDNYIDDITERCLGEIEAKELDRYPVHFFCRCNRDRFLGAIALLSVDDLDDMKSEDQEVVCHYCNEAYTIHKEEIQEMANEAKAKMN